MQHIPASAAASPKEIRRHACAERHGPPCATPRQQLPAPTAARAHARAQPRPQRARSRVRTALRAVPHPRHAGPPPASGVHMPHTLLQARDDGPRAARPTCRGGVARGRAGRSGAHAAHRMRRPCPAQVPSSPSHTEPTGIYCSVVYGTILNGSDSGEAWRGPGRARGRSGCCARGSRPPRCRRPRARDGPRMTCGQPR